MNAVAAPESRPCARGFTLIELIVVMAIIALLVSVVAPRYFNSLERAKENSVKTSLNVMRHAIDQYAADKGRYPDSLEQLVKERYLRAVPEDALTGEVNSWVRISPPPDADVRGQLFDVRSGKAGRAPDGRLYADW